MGLPTKYITYNGKTQSLKEWSRSLGINLSTLRQRIRIGWEIEDAFERPVNNKGTQNILLKRFGKLLPIFAMGVKTTWDTEWLCKCDCGDYVVKSIKSLRGSIIPMCKLCFKEYISGIQTTHGKTKTEEYTIWLSMKQRCYFFKHKHYHHYGGRGIYVCRRWRNSFENFLKDVGHRPNRKYSIDRIDNNGPYGPWNVKWSSPVEQAQNKRNCKIIRFEGESMSMAAWARKKGIKYTTLKERLRKGWEIKDALEIPVKRRSK